MNDAVVYLTIFVLSIFVGIEVISKVSSTLHTPLMSGANAIHGVILLGAILVTGSTDNTAALVVGVIAIVLASVNMVGGFVVTDRMLQMFTQKKKPAKASGSGSKTPAKKPAAKKTTTTKKAAAKKPAAKKTGEPKTAAKKASEEA